MRGHGAKFARKKEEAIAALLTQRTTEEAARAIGIAPATLLRWMKEPEFDSSYREARRAAFGQSVARLQQASGAAVTTLLKVMVDSNTLASTKVRAADSVLNHTAKAIELDDIEARLSESSVYRSRPHGIGIAGAVQGTRLDYRQCEITGLFLEGSWLALLRITDPLVTSPISLSLAHRSLRVRLNTSRYYCR
jgi:transposase-like protein